MMAELETMGRQAAGVVNDTQALTSLLAFQSDQDSVREVVRFLMPDFEELNLLVWRLMENILLRRQAALRQLAGL